MLINKQNTVSQQIQYMCTIRMNRNGFEYSISSGRHSIDLNRRYFFIFCILCTYKKEVFVAYNTFDFVYNCILFNCILHYIC